MKYKTTMLKKPAGKIRSASAGERKRGKTKLRRADNSARRSLLLKTRQNVCCAAPCYGYGKRYQIFTVSTALAIRAFVSWAPNNSTISNISGPTARPTRAMRKEFMIAPKGNPLFIA